MSGYFCPGVASFAAPCTVRVYLCSGCGERDDSTFEKEGVDHWRRVGTPGVCGQWVNVKTIPAGVSCLCRVLACSCPGIVVHARPVNNR